MLPNRLSILSGQAQLRAILLPRTRGGISGPSGSSTDIEIVVSLLNEGRAIAFYPHLEIRVPPPFKISQWGLDGNRNIGLPEAPRSLRAPDWRIYTGGVNNAIHPGLPLDVATITLEVNDRTHSVPDLAVEVVIAAEGIASQPGVEKIPGEELLALAMKQLKKSFG